ncbi:uncharacterized protein LOC144445835 [Glandiceps talaboti]
MAHQNSNQRSRQKTSSSARACSRLGSPRKINGYPENIVHVAKKKTYVESNSLKREVEFTEARRSGRKSVTVLFLHGYIVDSDGKSKRREIKGQSRLPSHILSPAVMSHNYAFFRYHPMFAGRGTTPDDVKAVKLPWIKDTSVRSSCICKKSVFAPEPLFQSIPHKRHCDMAKFQGLPKSTCEVCQKRKCKKSTEVFDDCFLFRNCNCQGTYNPSKSELKIVSKKIHSAKCTQSDLQYLDGSRYK